MLSVDVFNALEALETASCAREDGVGLEKIFLWPKGACIDKEVFDTLNLVGWNIIYGEEIVENCKCVLRMPFITEGVEGYESDFVGRWNV